MAELKAGKYSNAIELFNRMILLSNNISDLYYGRGLAFYHSNNFEAAINDFNSYINLSPNSSIGYMGVCLSYLGQAQRQDVTSDTRHKLINNTISIVNKIINTFPNNYGLVYINGLANF
jgi:tetratricopeptide (TPR) repeat protein